MKRTMEKMVALAKTRGFIYPGSEIYGGLANSWDYGPLGVELKNNLKKAWWDKFVRESKYNVGVDCAILMSPRVWQASGHLSNFSDPLMDCKVCNERFRADKLIEEYITKQMPSETTDGWDNLKMKSFIDGHNIKCPSCGSCNFTDIRKFNLMFKTFGGVTEDSKSTLYLRPETAQGIFVNFKNVQRSRRKKIPFGIAQIGKSFRNEITPGNFIFRTREFEQMELEFFCEPDTDLEWYNYWKRFCMDWLISLNIKAENLRFRDHTKDELSFYSKATSDIEYKFPFGWGELWGIADRTDYDLKQHNEFSDEEINYFDQDSNKRYIPYCIEPSLGADRAVLVLLCDAYDDEEVGENDIRVVLRFHPAIAPIKAAILPLSKKLSGEAYSLYEDLSKHFMCDYDESGSIGKRYRRQDEVGTPFCITYDYDSKNDNCVTIRDRDHMTQERISIKSVEAYVNKRLRFQ